MFFKLLISILSLNLSFFGYEAKTDAQWRQLLNRDQYNVMRRKGTEKAFSGHYLHEWSAGIYTCAACQFPLFRSEDKYEEPGCGWPTFKKTISSKNVFYKEDLSFGFKRFEVLCRQCESHLGHVFNDGPPPKHLRYTINSVSLKLETAKVQ